MISTNDQIQDPALYHELEGAHATCSEMVGQSGIEWQDCATVLSNVCCRGHKYPDCGLKLCYVCFVSLYNRIKTKCQNKM